MELLVKESDKRVVAAFIPYRKRDTEYEFYLQMRSKDAPTNPGIFGMFGGGVEEGESPEEGFLREVQEELVYAPQRYEYLSRIETMARIFHVYIEEVSSNFETKVNVLEGDYGKFLTLKEIQSSEVSLSIPVLFSQFSDFLNNRHG